MAKKNDATIYHGEIIDKIFADKQTFPINCKFKFTNASYNEIFTVVGNKIEPGTEYRRLLGASSGEVWILLTTLQKEAALGSIEYIKQPTTAEENLNEKQNSKRKRKNKKE